MEREALDTNTAPSATAPAPATVVGLKPRRVKRGARTRYAADPFDAIVSQQQPQRTLSAAQWRPGRWGIYRETKIWGASRKTYFRRSPGSGLAPSRCGARRAGVDQEPLGIDSSAAASLLSRIPL